MPGLPFQGSYGNIGGQQSVRGVTPTEYPISLQGGFDVVSAAFQKQDASDAVLRVEIVSGGSVVGSRETSAAYGVVTVTQAHP